MKKTLDFRLCTEPVQNKAAFSIVDHVGPLTVSRCGFFVCAACGKEYAHTRARRSS